jgi:amidophosphoribosyltransferase
MAPCFYGIDMSRLSGLIAPKFFAEPRLGDQPAAEYAVLARELEADSLRYLTIEALVEAIGFAESDLCLGCLLGRYPTPCGNALFDRARDVALQGVEGRTYEGS